MVPHRLAGRLGGWPTSLTGNAATKTIQFIDPISLTQLLQFHWRGSGDDTRSRSVVVISAGQCALYLQFNMSHEIASVN